MEWREMTAAARMGNKKEEERRSSSSMMPAAPASRAEIAGFAQSYSTATIFGSLILVLSYQ